MGHTTWTELEARLGLAFASDKGEQEAENKHRAFGHQLFQSSIVLSRGDMDPVINSVDGGSQDASASLYGSVLHGLPQATCHPSTHPTIQQELNKLFCFFLSILATKIHQHRETGHNKALAIPGASSSLKRRARIDSVDFWNKPTTVSFRGSLFFSSQPVML